MNGVPDRATSNHSITAHGRRTANDIAPPTALTIAGSDSGGSAGMHADLRTFQACGVHGMTAVTAVTVQNTMGVTDVVQIPAETVVAQIDAGSSDSGADAARLPGSRYSTAHTHGAGDVFGAAITAALAKGASVPDAVRYGKRFVTHSVRHAYPLGSGVGPVSTLWRISPRSV